MIAWTGAALLLCAPASIALAIALRRERRRLVDSEKERREIERSSQILEEERHVLELIARGGTLKEVLEALTRAVEKIVPGVCCSVLLVDRERGCLVQGAAPNLHPDYWQMCDGVPILPDLGCCPSAVARNETVICEDMGTDPRWASIRDQVLAFGLRSCWSEPIRDSETGCVIGTFAMYRGIPAKPEAFHLRAVRAGAQLAGNAIERLRTIQHLSDYAARFALAEKAASFGIWEWDPASGLFDLSKECARMASVGEKSIRVTGEELYATVHPDDREPARKARELVVEKGGLYEHEYRRISADGSIRWFRNRGKVELKEGGRAKVIGAVIDITDSKDLVVNLERAKTAAEEAVRAKGQFLANMSHEIRTPMNAVVGMTSLLLDLDLPAEARDYVETVRVSSDSLLVLINDILDFSKIESGKLDLEHVPFSLRECLEDAGELLAPKAAEKDLELAVDFDPAFDDWIFGDPGRLRQIMVNLIGNAVKFTEKGEVVIAVREAARPGPRQIAIDVRDTGIGIPREKHDRLFRSFSQIDSSTTRRFGGTGLGLSISFRLAELMGGRLTVVSEAGAGSTFRVTLPYKPSPSLRPAPLALAGWKGKRVLVADGNTTNRQILAAYLSNWQLAVETAPSAAAALSRIGAEAWDLIALDWRLREADGVDLALAVKARLGSGAPPIVMLGSAAVPLRSAFGARPNLVAPQINKPYRRQQLHRVLSHVLSGSAMPQSAARSLGLEFASRMPLRILVAEDNVVNRKVAMRLLERWGYRPDTAQNGVEVLEAVERARYDLVLLDVQMPEMDGIEAARRICGKWASDRPQLIALTAGAFKEDRDRCMEAGMDGFLAKPLNVAELQSTLELCYTRATADLALLKA